MKILMEKQFNLQDVFKDLADSIDEEFPWQYVYSFKFSTALATILKYTRTTYISDLIKFAEWDSDNNVYVYKDYVEEMLNDFYPRFYKYFAAACFKDDRAAFVEARDEFFVKFLNVMNVTYPKYALIIKALKDNEAKLMAGLTRDYTDDGDSSGTVTSRFNDTPQDGGLFEDDTHTTNVNETSSTSDSGLEHKEEYNNEYMIDRINKIRDNLSNIFTEWENKVATILWR